VVSLPGANEKLDWYIHCVSDGRFPGIICTWMRELPTDLPVVYADVTNLDHIPGLHQVRNDSRSGAEMLTDWVLKQGRKCPVFVHDAPEPIETIPRCSGFLDSLREAGFRDGPQRIFLGACENPRRGELVIREMLRRYPETDALVCESDPVAFRFRNVLQTFFPDRDILTTGFGNVIEYQSPHPFPTVEQHPEEIGVRAATRLINLIENTEITEPLIEELPVELIV